MPLDNFAFVHQHMRGSWLMRSAQPDMHGLLSLQSILPNSIVYKLNQEKEPIVFPVEQYPMKGDNPWGLSALRDLVREIHVRLAGGKSVLVHCTHGRDRTGLVIGVWRAIVEDWPFDQIMQEKSLFGTPDLFEDVDEEGTVRILKQATER